VTTMERNPKDVVRDLIPDYAADILAEDELLAQTVLVTTWDKMISTAASRYDIDRFGAGLFRATPRQADLMIVSGTVTKKMVPIIIRLYNQMPEPKYVIAMGACATGGGPFKEGYNVVPRRHYCKG